MYIRDRLYVASSIVCSSTDIVNVRHRFQTRMSDNWHDTNKCLHVKEETSFSWTRSHKRMVTFKLMRNLILTLKADLLEQMITSHLITIFSILSKWWYKYARSSVCSAYQFHYLCHVFSALQFNSLLNTSSRTVNRS